MKTFIFALLLPLLSFANEYSITKDGQKYLLKHNDHKWELLFQAQEPKLLSVKKINESIDLVIYKSEEAGTKYIIQMDKAVLVNVKKKELITKEPLDYKYTNLKTNETEAEATYQIKDKKLLWKFEDEETTIPLESSSN